MYNACECKEAKQNNLSQPRAVSQQSAFITFITYNPQLMHSEQIDNRKQTFWQNKVHWVKQTFQ